MSHYNVIIGYFDGSGTSMVSTSRFYLPKGMTEYAGQTPSSGTLKAFCTSIPTVFTEEISYNRVPMARLGWIDNITQSGRDLKVSYSLPSGILPFQADRMAAALNLSNEPRRVGTMQHSHWTIGEGDLLRTLQQAGVLESTQPTVFQTPLEIQSNLVSVMMPFGGQFTPVYTALKGAVEALGYECNRADNIWEHSTVIQDIFSLIFRSKVVVCDFSEKNPNVFYEAGLAHALGRHVIPIVQHQDDVPFDLRHHRYIQYLNNKEGVEKLAVDITPRLETLMSL